MPPPAQRQLLALCAPGPRALSHGTDRHAERDAWATRGFQPESSAVLMPSTISSARSFTARTSWHCPATICPATKPCGSSWIYRPRARRIFSRARPVSAIPRREWHLDGQPARLTEFIIRSSRNAEGRRAFEAYRRQRAIAFTARPSWTTCKGCCTSIAATTPSSSRKTTPPFTWWPHASCFLPSPTRPG